MGARKHNHVRRHKTSRVSRKRDPTRMRGDLFGANTVAAAWDVRKTVRQNYEAMGLASDMNEGKDIEKHAPGMLAEALGIKVTWVDLPEAAALAAKVAAASRNPERHIDYVSREEIEYLTPLAAKYLPPGVPADAAPDAAFTKMAHDLKGNWKQHAPGHLRSRIARMHRYLADTTGGGAGAGGAAGGAAGGSSAAPAPAAHRGEDRVMSAVMAATAAADAAAARPAAPAGPASRTRRRTASDLSAFSEALPPPPPPKGPSAAALAPPPPAGGAGKRKEVLAVVRPKK